MSGDVRPGRPPQGTRFRKGQSGNPRGRPKKRRPPTKSGSAFDVIIDKTITVTQGGGERELTVDEALQLQIYKDALAGNRAARRTILMMIEKREAWLAKNRPAQQAPPELITEPTDPNNADAALLLLGIACRDQRWPSPRGEREDLLLEPWAVQAALSRRRGGSKLKEKQKEEIRRCTRDAEALRWPREAGR